MADKFQFLYADPTLTKSKWACATGSTGLFDKVPYGTFVNDTYFCSESVDVCQWVARRLGHPVMQLEFGSGSSKLNFLNSSLNVISDILYLISSYHPSNRKSLMLNGSGTPVSNVMLSFVAT